MMMYKKKNRDFAPEDMKLDKVFFAAAFYFPFLTYPLHRKEAAAILPFPISARLASGYENVLLFVLILVTLVYLVRQGQKWQKASRSIGPNNFFSHPPFPSTTCSSARQCPC